MSEDRLFDIIRESSDAVSEAWEARDARAAERARIRYLGRKGGELSGVMRSLKDLSADEKRVVGSLANSVRSYIEASVSAIKEGKKEAVVEAHRALGEALGGRGEGRGAGREAQANGGRDSGRRRGRRRLAPPR